MKYKPEFIYQVTSISDMPKSLVLGNGTVLVCLNADANLSDFYFPYVGLENHIGGHYKHRIGVYADGNIRWFGDPSWKIETDYIADTLAGITKAVNDFLQVQMTVEDVVYNEKNIFLREVTLKNVSDRDREIKIYFHHQFELYESHRGDTAYYDPIKRIIIHYKGRRIFLINAVAEHRQFDDYSIGLFEIEGKEGTHKDADDGKLSKNPVEHGLVDSVIGLTLFLKAGQKTTINYWMTASKHMHSAFRLNEYVLKRTPEYLMQSTKNFWKAWTNKQNFSFYGLDNNIISLFKKSLLCMRAHVGNNGSILASGDSDMLQHGRDTYSYVWPRDGAQVAIGLDKAGDVNVAKRFFEFCKDIITEEGFFMHKYRSDKSLGSSWHPWLRNGRIALPIQEDETALVVYALWKHYYITKDIEFIEELYNPVIKKAAEFMVDYRDPSTKLPKASYDLWEEKWGTHTFSCSAVYGALKAASRIASLLGKKNSMDRYNEAANEVKEAILHHLWDQENRTFLKSVNIDGDQMIPDKTIDMSSIYGIFKFGVLGIEDERVKQNIEVIKERLSPKTEVGGIARYEGDYYYRNTSDVPGNPWFITTLWLAQYYIEVAKQEADLNPVKEILKWTSQHTSRSGVLSEQLDPHSGAQVSAAPLTWSHAEYVITVIEYLEKLEHMGISKVFYPI